VPGIEERPTVSASVLRQQAVDLLRVSTNVPA
jgi:hypothetical protein